MNNFMVSMNVFSKGLCIFAIDLRADRHSDWYCIRSVSLVIIEGLETSNLLKKSMNYAILFTFIISRLSLFFQHISSCLTIRFDNISMTSLVFSNQLLPVLLFNY